MNDLKVAIKLSTEGGKVVVKDITQLDDAVGKANRSLKDTDKSGTVAKQGFDKASSGAKGLSQQTQAADIDLKGMLKTASAMLAGYVSIAGGIAAINKADNFNVLTQRIKTATKATGDFVSVNAELYDITQDNRANLESTVEMFQRMSSARNELEATNAEMLIFTDAIQELGVIGGTAVANIKAGQTQLAQMLSGNVARAEEFNSILENTPEVAQRIAKGLGVSVGKLREMMLDGQLLSKDVFRAILSQTSQIHADFEGIATSIESGKQQADNAFGSALSRLDEISGVTASIAKMFVDIANTLDGMNAEELQELSANIAAIGGGLATLVFLKTFNINVAAMGIAAFTATKSILTKIAAMRAAAVSTNIYGQVVASSTTKIIASTVATRALSVATSTLLGPIGLAITAGFMLYEAFSPEELGLSADAVDELAEKEKKLAEATEKAAKAKENQAPSSNLNDHLQLAYEKQAMLIAQIAAMEQAQVAVNAQYGNLSDTAQKYGEQLTANKDELANMQRYIASLLGLQKEQTAEQQRQALAAKSEPVALRQLETLQQQIALHGELSLVKQLDYRIEHGNLQGINKQLAQQLLAEAKKLELLNKQAKAQASTTQNNGVISSLENQLQLLKKNGTTKVNRY